MTPDERRLSDLTSAAALVGIWERESVTVPCPDGIKGCLVLHTRVVKGPIETAILEMIKRG